METHVLSPTGQDHLSVTEEKKGYIQNEVDLLDGKKNYKGKYELEMEEIQKDVLTITFLSGDYFTMEITPETTVKQIKTFLGTQQELNEKFHRCYRLLSGDIELKVTFFSFSLLLKKMTSLEFEIHRRSSNIVNAREFRRYLQSDARRFYAFRFIN